MNIEDIKKLRATTGAGMMDAKAALEEAGGDFDKAIAILRKKGLAKAAKKADRSTAVGVIESYVHSSKIGVLVEVNCETDFVARTDDFKAFTKDLAMHITASNPTYLNPQEIPEDELNAEKDAIKDEVLASGKPAEVVDKIIEGKLGKWYQEVCLSDQLFIKDPEQTIEQLRQALVGKLGENIVIARFVRFEVGGA
ncbi:translation elongation factor Ts [Patescibacteria group bacterium]|jgi:elongation factor Ts|nr:translation elongation factor Ts [Patescibacteria group bacterium]